MSQGPGMLAETFPAGISSPMPHGIILHAVEPLFQASPWCTGWEMCID